MALEILGALLLVLGGVFCFAAGLGVVRFPDVFMRMHAATKAGTLGLIFLVGAMAFVTPALDIILKAVLVSVFMIVTAPVGSHLIGRAAYRTGSPLWSRTEIDEGARIFMRHERAPGATRAPGLAPKDGAEAGAD
ncbi:MAG: monovalent cation/H(+) antiporter subunit G [Paracoccaceae bacterium]